METLVTIASGFCTKMGPQLGFATENIQSECIDKIAALLHSETHHATPTTNSIDEANLITIPLTIAGTQYDFKLPDINMETLVTIASGFCTKMGPQLGFATENIQSECIDKIAALLYSETHPNMPEFPKIPPKETINMSINGYIITLDNANEETLFLKTVEYCKSTSKCQDYRAQMHIYNQLFFTTRKYRDADVVKSQEFTSGSSKSLSLEFPPKNSERMKLDDFVLYMDAPSAYQSCKAYCQNNLEKMQVFAKFKTVEICADFIYELHGLSLINQWQK